ncbi:hypothetical protein JXB11_02725 [Candidatus Woesearchaeota archaeon]|nr:hypothetical protein [Candidatus Woesearchaeota archaeon]
MVYRIAPLPGTFMLMSIMGFLISAVYTASGRLDLSWGFSFAFVFALMFIASVLSITPTFPRELASKSKK